MATLIIARCLPYTLGHINYRTTCTQSILSILCPVFIIQNARLATLDRTANTSNYTVMR